MPGAIALSRGALRHLECSHSARVSTLRRRGRKGMLFTLEGGDAARGVCCLSLATEKDAKGVRKLFGELYVHVPSMQHGVFVY